MIAIASIVLSALIRSAQAIEAFDPEFYANPWSGVCAAGMMQTPIDLPSDHASMATVPDELVTTINMPVVNDPITRDTGHSMKVRRVAVCSSETECSRLAFNGCNLSDLCLVPALHHGWHTSVLGP
jgi:hypothetical protein